MGAQKTTKTLDLIRLQAVNFSGGTAGAPADPPNADVARMFDPTSVVPADKKYGDARGSVAILVRFATDIRHVGIAC